MPFILKRVPLRRVAWYQQNPAKTAAVGAGLRSASRCSARECMGQKRDVSSLCGRGRKSLQKWPMKEGTNIRGEDCDETLPRSGGLFIYCPYEAPLPVQAPKSKGSRVRGRESKRKAKRQGPGTACPSSSVGFRPGLGSGQRSQKSFKSVEKVKLNMRQN